MRISLITVAFVLFAGQGVGAMKRSPRKALAIEDQELQLKRPKEWPAVGVSPAEPTKSSRIKAAVKTAGHLHAKLLRERLQAL
jgi:hypothetical protein